MISRIEELLRNNRAFVEQQLQLDEDYFDKLAEGQHPEFLWVGCSDSRVPPDRITGTKEGDMFVHRNIANLVVQTDMNFLSVLQYAVDVLHVEHVIVVGHYGCGGIRAALANKPLGLIDNWLRHVQDVADRHADMLAALDEHARVDRLCELNVVEQVKHVARTTIVQDAWQRGQALTLHGWVYGISDGLVKDLRVEADSVAKLEADYQAALAAVARSGR